MTQSDNTSASGIFLPMTFAALLAICCIPLLNSLLDGFARPLIDFVIRIPDAELVLSEWPIGPDETEINSIKYGLIIRELLAMLVIAAPLCFAARWILGRRNTHPDGG